MTPAEALRRAAELLEDARMTLEAAGDGRDDVRPAVAALIDQIDKLRDPIQQLARAVRERRG